MLLVNVMDGHMRDVGIINVEQFENARFMTRADLFEFKNLEDAKAFIKTLGSFEVLFDKSKDDKANLFYGPTEGVFKGMTFILWMRFFVDYLPVAIVRKESIGLCWCVIDLCQT